MSASILTFHRPLKSAKSLEPMFVGPAARTTTLMSVPEAAFQTYFESPEAKNPMEVISRLTGVSVEKLRDLWGGPSGLREAGIRYALSMAMG
jgi:hypothetical protein